MYAIAIVVLGMFLIFSSIESAETKQVAFTDQVGADVSAANFWSYQKSVASYFTTHTGVTGTIADGVLTFQLGYIRNPAWTNTVSAGVLYTYSNAELPSGAISAIAKRGGLTMTVGVANHGTMVSQTAAASGFALPAVIPDGAVVVIGN